MVYTSGPAELKPGKSSRFYGPRMAMLLLQSDAGHLVENVLSCKALGTLSWCLPG